MKILVIGGTGMLGHQLVRHFSQRHEVEVTVRRPVSDLPREGQFLKNFPIHALEATDVQRLRKVIQQVQPNVVFNCVGIIKQLKEASDPTLSITVNSLLPHQLARICGEVGARVFLFSTDCVFSGRRGAYTEADVPDAYDLYGRTKLLGEVADARHVVTLRSSIIGRELGTAHSLVDWFLSQSGKTVKGYKRAMYSGFTTLEMARILEMLIERFPAIHGLWQVASESISKFEVLTLLNREFGTGATIIPDEEFVCDRTLVGDRFNSATMYRPPTWPAMIAEMARESVG